MFRKILIGVVASLALLAPFVLPSVSEAHGRRVAVRHAHYRHVNRSAPCRVYYRTSARGPWVLSGSYGCRADAVRACNNLHCYQTVIR